MRGGPLALYALLCYTNCLYLTASTSTPLSGVPCFEGTSLMSRMCVICGKKPSTGCNVSHSQRHTKRRWLPNLQNVRVQTESGNKHMRVCTSCIKAGKVRKAG